MKYGNTLLFDDQINKSINNLFTFLKDVKHFDEQGNVKIILHGMHLPPLNDKDRDQIL